MEIITKKITDLTQYENNPRKNDHAVEKTAAAIKEFGFRVPLLIKSNGEIIDGHLRYKAAMAAGMTEVPCILADDMSETQIKAFRISVNKVAELAEWDDELLKIELTELDDDLYDIKQLGFAEDFLKEEEIKLVKIDTANIIQRAWVLISVPIDKYIDIREEIESMSNNPSIEIETTVT